MESLDSVPKPVPQFVPVERGLAWRALLFSLSAHCLVIVLFLWLVALQRSAPMIALPRRPQTAQRIPAAAVSLPPKSQSTQLPITVKNARRLPNKPQGPEAHSTGEGEALEALRARASEETKALIQDFKFRTAYGFSPLPRYELAFQLSGEIPPISADQLPPHYEQYVIVEVTITTEGRVADARIVAGVVDSKIQQTLLAAVREFKYRPATRGGTPIPSQCDLVIHIPT